MESVQRTRRMVGRNALSVYMPLGLDMSPGFRGQKINFNLIGYMMSTCHDVGPRRKKTRVKVWIGEETGNTTWASWMAALE